MKEVQRVYQCPNCGRSYKRLQYLRKHQNWDCGKDPQFKCNLCPYKSYQGNNLKRHFSAKHPNAKYNAENRMD